MAKSSKNMKDDSKLWAFLGVFLMVLGFILVLLAKKENRYAMHYARQGLVLFIAYVGVWIASWIVGWIPVLGTIISVGLGIILFVLWIIGIIYSFSGEEKDIPLIGEFARKIKV